MSNISKYTLTKPVIIQAVEHDGFDTRHITIELNVQENMNRDDVLEAMKKASMEYCRTKEGKETYEGNCNNFNYGDFSAYVPNSICIKYGIQKADVNTAIFSVIFDTQLVSETDVLWAEEE